MATKLLTDEEIQRQVLNELKWDPEVEPTDVGVEVDSGVVTLTGTVESYSMKFAAEKAVKRVKGVKAVANDIQVMLPFERTRTDTDIARAAAQALEWNTEVPHERIKVTVKHGWITLEGNVDWPHQKEAAVRNLRALTGVQGVINLIAVAAPRIPDQEVKTRLEEALDRSAQVDARRVQVKVRDGKVILGGSLHSWVERKEAENAARSTTGVSEVENRIIVEP